MDVYKTRKSCRRFKEQPVKQEDLDVIIEAGQYAPSGGNSKSGKFVIFKNKEIIDDLQNIVQKAFAAMEYQEDMYISLKNSINLSKKGNYRFAYSPDVLIVFINKKSYGNSMADSVCALENMTLRATELQIGSCYINQLHWLTGNETVRAFMKDYHLEEDEDIYCALSLGYPEDEDFFTKERKIKLNQVYVY